MGDLAWPPQLPASPAGLGRREGGGGGAHRGAPPPWAALGALCSACQRAIAIQAREAGASHSAGVLGASGMAPALAT